MDTRHSAGRASAPPVRQTPRPSPEHAARSRVAQTPAASGAQPVPDDFQVAPWDMTGTDRPAALPAPQAAPWRAGPPQLDAPWTRAPERDIAPWETGRHEAASTTEPPGREVLRNEEPPAWDEAPAWDEPAPFNFDELVADDAADPYDAFAPLADDFAPDGGSIRPRMTAPPIERPATPEFDPPEDRAPTVDVPTAMPAEPIPAEEADTGQPEPVWARDAGGSVFGDAFITPGRPRRNQAKAAEARRGDKSDELWSAAAASEAASEATAGEPAAADSPAVADEQTVPNSAATEQPAAPNPVEWPPVPTDFPPADRPAPRARRQPTHNPVSWPPIPGDLLHVPDLEPASAGTRASQPSVWDASASELPGPAPTGDAMSMAEAAPAGATSEYGLEDLTSVPQAFSLEFEPPATPVLHAPATASASEALVVPPWDVAPLPGLEQELADPRGPEVEAPPAFAHPAKPQPPAARPSPAPANETAPQNLGESPAEHELPEPELPEPELPEPELPELELPEPSRRRPPQADDQHDAFARHAASGSASATMIAPAAAQVTTLPSYEPRPTATPAEAVAEAGSGDSGDLWFLASEPRETSTVDEATETEPSPVQTTIMIVLAALVCIGLVLLFLRLFTGFFA